jgi:predicted N-acetyltransferase YhbS
MKIQKVTEEPRAKVYALLRRAFSGSEYEAELVRKLHEHGKPLHEWVCIHTNKVILPTSPFPMPIKVRRSAVCTWHLWP